jgi:hypothetical protein
MKAYLLARLREPSTWRGLVTIGTLCGWALSPEQQEAVIIVGVLLVGLLGAAVPDK